ncbi:hypothetical protein SDC9_165031 [bioreactor metagenome]|uniref:Condensin complex subunit 1 C-terminal domain-containing protein n=1 Tax=bioreactor metagenome TaxID=1076179 RepID=A0A645FV45_9ZZZZ
MIINELISVIKECLNSKTQLYGEKISCLRFVLFMNKTVNNNFITNEIIKLVSNLVLDEITEGRGEILFDKNTKLTLVFNYLLVRMEVLNCDSVDMLECISGFHNGESIEYIYYLQGLDNYFKYSQYKSDNKEIELLLIFSMNSMIVSDDFEVRLEAVKTLFSLYKRSNKKIALRLINMLVNDMDYRVKVSILSEINKLENDDILSFTSILDKLRVDNNYIVRNYSNQLIERVELSTLN